MGIKVTNGELVNGWAALQQLVNLKLPVRTSFLLAQTAKSYQEHRKIAIDEMNKLIEKHGEKSEKTGQYGVSQFVNASPEDAAAGKPPVPNPKWAEWEKEREELFALETELKDIEAKVRLPEKVAATCDKCHHNMDKPLEIEAAILLALDKFVELAPEAK